MKFQKVFFLVSALCAGTRLHGWAAETRQPLEIATRYVGTAKTTSFPKVLYVHITNPGYTPVDLGKLMREAELIIDGKPSRRVPKPFLGVQGLPPMGEWDGCLSLADFEPKISAGTHKVSLKMGGMQTPETKLHWEDPIAWEKGDLKSRLKEIKQLALALEDGLPQSCSEMWLTRKDGGPQEEDKIRYFLEPRFKMVVPYRQMYQPSGMHSVVDGTPTIYEEQPLHD